MIGTLRRRAPSREAIRPSKRAVLWGTALIGIQAYLTLTYVWITGRAGGVDLFVLVPWIWINVALLAFLRADAPAVAGRDRLLPAGIAGGYFLILLGVSGTIGLGTAFSDAVPRAELRLLLFDVPPGWAPTVIYAGEFIRVALRPPLLLGYAAIAYLLYATIARSGAGVIGGVVGLFSCVGCMVPIVASAVAVLTGSTAGYLQPENLAVISGYDISTAVFLLTVFILWFGYRSTADPAGGTE